MGTRLAFTGETFAAMNTSTKIIFSAVLLAVALLSDGILALPAFAAAVFVWGVKL